MNPMASLPPSTAEWAIYKNAFGLDPMFWKKFKEVAPAGSRNLINKFMLASDHYWWDFVKKVTRSAGEGVLHTP